MDSLLGARDAVGMEGGKVGLNRDQLWVDMWEFEEELQRPHDPEANGIGRIGRLRLLYQGHFLQHETEKSWVLKARQELRDRLLRAIRDAARERERSRRWEDAANLYRSGIELDSLNEGLYRGLMLCHQELGDHSEALQASRHLRRWSQGRALRGVRERSAQRTGGRSSCRSFRARTARLGEIGRATRFRRSRGRLPGTIPGGGRPLSAVDQ